MPKIFENDLIKLQITLVIKNVIYILKAILNDYFPKSKL